MSRYCRRNAPVERLNYHTWPEVCPTTLDGEVCTRFTSLRRALIRYIDGDKVKEIEADEGYFCEELIRALNRCITLRPDGRLVGWAGLLLGVRLRRPVRVKPLSPNGRNGKAGLTGACDLFMRTHTELKAAFDRYLLKTASRQPGHENKVRHGVAHRKFIKLCRDQGLSEHHWPLNTDKEGRGAIYDYVNQFLASHYDAIVATQYGHKAKTKSKTGTGEFTRLRADRFLDVVELDEHLCHFKGWIAFETPGGKRWVKSPRLSLIGMVDRALGLVIGLKIIFRSQARADDILDVLHHACGGGGQRLDASEAGGLDDPAMPADLGLPFTWCSFNQLLLDNALAHIAERIHGRARTLLGCDINLGPVRRPDRRPYIEGLFSELARLGFHRLRETTGSGPQDPIRIEPPPASEPQMSESQAVALIYRSVRFHNRKRSKGAYGVRRIEQLQTIVADNDQGLIFPVLPPLLEDLPSLNINLIRLKVLGDKDEGKRPHLYLQEETYFGTVLSDRWDLIGEWIMVHMDRPDARYMRLFLENGTPLGTAEVRGRWRYCPHTLDQRILVNKLIRDGQLRMGYDEDPMVTYLDQLAQAISRGEKLLPPQAKSVAVHAEHQQALQQHAQAIAQPPAGAAVPLVHIPPPVKEREEERRFVMPELRAFSGRQR